MTTTRQRWQAVPLLGRPVPRRLDPRLYDAVVALLLLFLLVASFGGRVLPGQRAVNGWAWVLAAGLTLPYAVHRARPWSALAVTLGSLLAFALAQYAPYPAVSVFVLVLGTTLHSPRRTALVGFGATILALLVALLAQPAGVVQAADATSTVLGAFVAALGGVAVRQRRARWAALEERAVLLERERDERDRAAVAAERLRIARELHDVVAHSMSLIAVQAGVGRHVIDTDVDGARQALGVIETTSRGALTEMRRLLGVLRQGDESVSLTPAPGLDDLPRLAADIRRSGVGVTLDLPADRGDVPAAADLTAYRIVQEALTNVVKHGGPVAHVVVACADGELRVVVTDDGRPAAMPGGPPGSGQGLIGMRERVSLYGGELSADRRPGGGFRVMATLPYAVEPPGDSS